MKDAKALILSERLLDVRQETKSYWKLKEAALDRTT
jgi:hypothetical protein